MSQRILGFLNSRRTIEFFVATFAGSAVHAALTESPVWAAWFTFFAVWAVFDLWER